MFPSISRSFLQLNKQHSRCCVRKQEILKRSFITLPSITNNKQNQSTRLHSKTTPNTQSFCTSKRNYFEFAVYNDIVKKWTQNETIEQWIQQRIALFQPARVFLCDGSEEEYKRLINKQIQTGTLIKLNPQLRPNSYLARSTRADTARVEDATYICSESETSAGPTNNWEDPEKMYRQMERLFAGSMRGRTMYVVPFCMGPIESPFAMYGVEVTDSPYVVCSMRIMTRMGSAVLDELQSGEKFWVPCVHSVGAPLVQGDAEDSAWPCSQDKYIVHFPEERRIWSYGSGYGGNAILGKKCLGLRIASTVAREEGWMAEHMLIIGVTNPQGVKKYFLGCFPSACGKTNLAMLDAGSSVMSEANGWKVECLGDDLAWIRYNPKDGKLYALNPENGFFGVAPGTSLQSNANAMKTISKNTIFTNVGLTEDNDIWWEDMTKEKPQHAIAWTRQEYGKESAALCAHPNGRFCVPIEQCPVLDPDWNNPEGVPISGILFGGRRSTTVPLVYQCFDWKHGVFTGSVMGSETTAAAAGLRGVLRIDPFSMRPFSGYNMADYFSHWLSFGDCKGMDKDDPNPIYSITTENRDLPKIFNVNWFRKDKGKYLWPGFSENLRVIKWIFDRCDQQETDMSNSVETPIGYIPKLGAANENGLFDTSNLQDTYNVNESTMDKIFNVDSREWLQEANKYDEFYGLFGERVPQELKRQLKSLKSRLSDKLSQEAKELSSSN